MRLRPSRYYVAQPDRPLPVDWTNPIASGLVLATFAGGERIFFDNVQGKPFTDPYTGTSFSGLSFTRAGRARYAPGNGGYVNALNMSPTGQMVGRGTALLVVRPRVVPASNPVILRSGDASSWDLVTLGITSAGYFSGAHANGTTLLSDAPYTPGEVYAVAFTNQSSVDEPNQQLLYVDGVRQIAESATGQTFNKVHVSASISGGGTTGAVEVLAAFVWSRVLSGSEIRAVSANPYQLFNQRGTLLKASVTPTADTSLVGAAVARTSAAGSLATSIGLAGAASARAAGAGTLTSSIPLAGAVLAQSNASGALTTAILLAGAATAQSSASGSLAGGAAALAGSAQASVVAAGALSTAIALTGAAVAQSSASGTLAAPGATLAGSAVAQGSASGTLSTAIALAGGAVSQSSASASFAGTAVLLTGASVASAVASGTLTASINLSGQVAARAAAAGALMTWVALTGSARASAAAGGVLSVGVNYVRAPSGSGYAPRRNEYQARPAQVGGARPSATEKAIR